MVPFPSLLVIAEGVWPLVNPNYFKQQEIMAKLGPFLATLMPASAPAPAPESVQQPKEPAEVKPKVEEIKAAKQSEKELIDRSYDIEMVSYTPEGKIRLLKEYRQVTGLGMKEAKDKVESVPFIAFKNIRRDEANAIIEKFASYGATMKLV